LLTDTGLANIVLLPYSINVATSTSAPSCTADFNSDGIVSVPDLLQSLSEFGCSSACETDLNLDGYVSIDDFLQVLGEYGAICE
jgi:hypothetical protein